MRVCSSLASSSAFLRASFDCMKDGASSRRGHSAGKPLAHAAAVTVFSLFYISHHQASALCWGRL